MIPDEFCVICGRIVDIVDGIYDGRGPLKVVCPNCGDVTGPFFNGMDVKWVDLDHSHDDEGE